MSEEDNGDGLPKKKKHNNGPGSNLSPEEQCGAKTKNRPGGRCTMPAGLRTDHPGQGRCWLHGGRSAGLGGKGISHGRYSKIKRASIREKIAELQQTDRKPLDLLPELELLRALVLDFIESYDETTTALLAWHESFRYPLQGLIDRARPRKVADLADAAKIVRDIAAVVHTIHEIETTGAITLATFVRVVEQMGLVVAKHVKDDEALTAIQRDWDELRVDAVPSYPGAEERAAAAREDKIESPGSSSVH
jgi:hypothetical protein